MKLTVTPFTVHKQVPLTISRGTSAGSTNLWLRLWHDGEEGWGEASPFSVGNYRRSTEELEAELQGLASLLEPLSPWDGQKIERILDGEPVSSAARAAVDVAIQDWIGQRVQQPLWQLWGLDRAAITPTAVTIGISSPEQAQQRLQLWQQVITVRSVKVKLGSPDGIAADQAMMTALLPQIPPDAKVSIDANGGWSLKQAVTMSAWLAERGVTYMEQPLSRGQEADLSSLYARSHLPIFVDESCFNSQDIPNLRDRVHGINIKLMKSGGLTEARRMIATARACGLQVMFGCYSDSALANTALAQLAPLADHLDLDSHLNLKDDPFQGAPLHNGCLIPADHPGLGVTRHASES